MKFFVIVTKQTGEKKSQKKEIFRGEHTSELTAWGEFCNKVRSFTINEFGMVGPHSVTMIDEHKTIFATFQIR